MIETQKALYFTIPPKKSLGTYSEGGSEATEHITLSLQYLLAEGAEVLTVYSYYIFDVATSRTLYVPNCHSHWRTRVVA